MASEPAAGYGRGVVRSSAPIAAVLLASSVARAEEDPWWGRDKALHFGVSALAAGGGYAASTLLVEPRWQRFALGSSAALSLGIAKELYDASGHGQASYRDLTWDAAGALVGASLALLVDIALAEPDGGGGSGASAGTVVIQW